MKRLYLIILCMLLTISAFAFPVSADTFYDNDGYLTIQSDTYDTSFAYYNPSSTPVLTSGVTIPNDMHLVVYGVHSNTNRAFYYFAPVDSSVTFYESEENRIRLALSSGTGFFVRDSISSNGTLSYSTSGNWSGLGISGDLRFTALVPVYDGNGDIVRPEGQITFNLNTAFEDQNLNLYFNASCNSSTDNPVSFYIFPSSVNITSGSQSTIISDTYVTETTPSQNAYLNYIFGGKLLIGEYYNDYLNKSTFGVIPKIVFSDTVTSTRFGNTFDPSSFGFPYLSLGSKVLSPSDSSYITQTFMLNIPSMDRSSQGVYLYNDLCIVAVLSFENRYFTARFDFSRSTLKSNGISAPNKLTPPVNYTGGTVSDFQELADYLQYLFQTNDNNRQKQDNNIITYLQTIPWTNFITGGVSAGLDGWLPELSNSLDYTFGNLFSDWFIPSAEQIEELEDELEDDREEFRQKFAFIDDLKDEVSFIFEAIMTAGDSRRQFTANLGGAYGVGNVTFFDTDQIPSAVLTAAKNLITVFLTLALILHIWRTLPSTIGKMPSGGD